MSFSRSSQKSPVTAAWVDRGKGRGELLARRGKLWTHGTGETLLQPTLSPPPPLVHHMNHQSKGGLRLQDRALIRDKPGDRMCKKQVKLGSIHPLLPPCLSCKEFFAHYFLAITIYNTVLPPHPCFPDCNQFTTKTAGPEDFYIAIWLILCLLLLVICIVNTGFALYLFSWSLFLQKWILLYVISMKMACLWKAPILHTFCVFKVSTLYFKPNVITWNKHEYHLAEIPSFLFSFQEKNQRKEIKRIVRSYIAN